MSLLLFVLGGGGGGGGGEWVKGRIWFLPFNETNIGSNMVYSLTLKKLYPCGGLFWHRNPRYGCHQTINNGNQRWETKDGTQIS